MALKGFVQLTYALRPLLLFAVAVAAPTQELL
jgi:hypothetical protein